MPGHDPLAIQSAHVLADGRTLFLEVPEIQPVNQLHLHLRVDSGPAQDLYATVHSLAAAFHRLLRVSARRQDDRRPSDPGRHGGPERGQGAQPLSRVDPRCTRGPSCGRAEPDIRAGRVQVRAGEPIKLTFSNPDVVPHNWALARPGTLAKVGDLVNKIIAEPDAATRHYIPRTDDILFYMDIVPPGNDFNISFHAPSSKGRYPFLCTFPGHWMVMNGVMTVE